MAEVDKAPLFLLLLLPTPPLQAQLKELRDGGFATHDWFGTFVLCAAGSGAQEALVAHFDCHDRHSGSSAWAKWRWRGAHTPDERWKELEEGADLAVPVPPLVARSRITGFGEDEGWVSTGQIEALACLSSESAAPDEDGGAPDDDGEEASDE